MQLTVAQRIDAAAQRAHAAHRTRLRANAERAAAITAMPDGPAKDAALLRFAADYLAGPAARSVTA